MNGRNSIQKALLSSLMKGELKELDEFLEKKIEQLPEIEESKDFLDAKKKTEEALVKRYLEIRERI